ncbi:acetyl esterase/lipase [Fontibacillus solani]|uniref:Acetyl esterase/lipase n=1 Tax=Fontibacillus solani TaxID=1572857 RepID=A0A7W3SSS3_9BACL|nr:acetyl esterase/lipase [Fontibacillus solani]
MRPNNSLKDCRLRLLLQLKLTCSVMRGEAYGNHLREAGVPVITVRFQGIIHDFVMLNALVDTQAARGALMLAKSWLRDR